MFLGLVYNEYIILLFFGLARDTTYEINKRIKDIIDPLGSEYDFDAGEYGVNFNSFYDNQFDDNLE